jgi:hypothetical protein
MTFLATKQKTVKDLNPNGLLFVDLIFILTHFFVSYKLPCSTKAPVLFKKNRLRNFLYRSIIGNRSSEHNDHH